MGVLVGRNSRMRASSHRTSIYDLVIEKKKGGFVNTSRAFEDCETETFHTTTKLTRHWRSFRSTRAIEWRDNIKLLEVRSSQFNRPNMLKDN